MCQRATPDRLSGTLSLLFGEFCRHSSNSTVHRRVAHSDMFKRSPSSGVPYLRKLASLLFFIGDTHITALPSRVIQT